MKLLFFIFIFIFSVTSCGPPVSQQERRPTNIDYEGNLSEEEEKIEEITDEANTVAGKVFASIKRALEGMNECDPKTPIAPSTTDIIFSVAGQKNPFGGIASCLQESLEEASENICDNQRELEVLHRKASGRSSQQDKIEQAWVIALENEQNYRDRLCDLSDDYLDKSESTGKDVIEEEYLKISQIFRQECNTYCRNRTR